MTASEKPRTGVRIAVTGAAGSLAADVIPGLAGLGHRIVGIDTRRPDARLPLEWVRCSVNDRAALADALAGCEAVVHLAGIPLETEWEDLLRVNIDGTHAVLEAARVRGIDRVVLASSIHAAGFTEVPSQDEKVPDTTPVRPNTYYGVSKAAVEALGSLYHDRHGMDVLCLRIASRFAEPENERMLSTWLSPADAVLLFDAAIRVASPGFRIVWGVSANERSYLSAEGGANIGYFPQDNAERFSGSLFEAAARDSAVLASDWDRRYIGGAFCGPQPPRFQPPAGEMPPLETDAESTSAARHHETRVS